MRLLLVEVRRLFARRFFWVGGIALLLGLGAVLAEQYLRNSEFYFTDDMADRTQALTVVLALFGFLIGATAVGAEWQHGTLGALLLWEPRRLRVFLMKLLAMFGGVTILAALAYATNLGGHWAVADVHGVAGDITPDLRRELALVTARGLALVLAFAAVGFALAFLFRRTAAALGALIAYVGIAEIGGRILFDPDTANRYLLSSYVVAWLNNGASLARGCSSGGDCGGDVIRLTLLHGGLYVGGVALLAVLVSALMFRRQEVI